MLESLSFIHRFEKGSEADARPLLLLHGTGGDENDLVQLGAWSRQPHRCSHRAEKFWKWPAAVLPPAS